MVVFFYEVEMRKNLGVIPAVFPMPVLMIGTYDENGVVDVMNAAWGQICEMDRVMVCLSPEHKTTDNIRKIKAFTVGIADLPHMKEADFFGIATGNRMSDKFERTGFTAEKSTFVNAPVIAEFPVTMECELLEQVSTEFLTDVFVGKIVNVTAREEVLDDKGEIDASKLQALIYDPFRKDYYVTGQRVGRAWSEGKPLMRQK